MVDEQRTLVAFLLVFFLPQVVLYAGGTVATGVLHAKRRFLAVAAAPMANTVVMVACLLAFRAVTDGSSSMDLTLGERLLLAAAGTGGVIAFTGVLMGACRATGFRLRPRLNGRDPRVVRVLHQAGWGIVLHTSAGVLLGGAILAGAAVEGGVVAYQVAWVFFLAPYAIFAQPIQTAILPEWVVEARDPTMARFGASVRWAIERIAVPVVPLLHAPYLASPEALPLEERPIDLLFIGSMNDRRRAWLDRIEAFGLNVAVFDSALYGPERDQFIVQALIGNSSWSSTAEAGRL